MDKKNAKKTDRRTFIKTTARYCLLAATAVAGAKLITRGKGALPSQDCINRFICRSCRVVPGCCLPQALSFRSASAAEPLN